MSVAPDDLDADIDELYGRVTSAILRAESAERAKDRIRIARAYLDVSFLEEEIAKLIPANKPEGEIARRGVVSAATAAQLYSRAIAMAETYMADFASSSALRSQLKELRDHAERENPVKVSAPVMVHPMARFQLTAA